LGGIGIAAQILPAPIGSLTLIGTGAALTEIRFGEQTGSESLEETQVLRLAAAELTAYFSGALRVFSIPLSPQGTAFQRVVWQALTDIPYGQTATYGEIAAMINNPNACRAVGMANNRNPLPIVIPCHRVIGADGRLVGYGGGLGVKEWLLELERTVTLNDSTLPQNQDRLHPGACLV